MSFLVFLQCTVQLTSLLGLHELVDNPSDRRNHRRRLDGGHLESKPGGLSRRRLVGRRLRECRQQMLRPYDFASQHHFDLNRTLLQEEGFLPPLPDYHFFFDFHLCIQQPELNGQPADGFRDLPREVLKTRHRVRPVPNAIADNEPDRRAAAFGHHHADPLVPLNFRFARLCQPPTRPPCSPSCRPDGSNEGTNTAGK